MIFLNTDYLITKSMLEKISAAVGELQHEPKATFKQVCTFNVVEYVCIIRTDMHVCMYINIHKRRIHLMSLQQLKKRIHL